ncbi:hypothetical protein F5K02_03510 [Bacillus amyloliquefaciens]|uniref:hypothetical protein n=1 Tax=Bacillus TaxID=1386 RepID=UPI001F4C9836|nr:hypothetical protein [Bacillus amyloliquefaciens]UNE49966.1 hypothetical protein F5K02_03510 [Bacillus amyloliquefaciens]
MQEMTKEKLQEQFEIATYKAASLLAELNEKNEKLAEYKALYTAAVNKLTQLQNASTKTQNENQNAPASAPVTE